MIQRKIKGLFLGIPILSEGSYTEFERLRRDGVGCGILSIFSYEANDYITSSILMLLCLSTMIHANVTIHASLPFRLTIGILSSTTVCVATYRSDVSGALPFIMTALPAYYGLMYFVGFDR